MPTVNNGLEGTNGTTITAANSGTAGDAFDAVNTTGTGATLTYVTGGAHGATSAQLVYAASVACNLYCSYTTKIGSQTQVWMRAYFKHSANPPVAVRLMQLDIGGATLCCAVTLLTTGKLQSSNTGGAAITTTTASVPLGAWYRVEYMAIGSTTVGQTELMLFATMDSNTPTETNTSTAAQNTGGVPNAVRFGTFNATTETSAFTLQIDDVCASTSGYPGPIQLIPKQVRQRVPLLTPSAARRRMATYGR